MKAIEPKDMSFQQIGPLIKLTNFLVKTIMVIKLDGLKSFGV
jgi:hypothetical protein